MKMHKWRMSFTMEQEKTVSKMMQNLAKQGINYKVEFDFAENRIYLSFEYPAKKYNSAIKQIRKCFNI